MARAYSCFPERESGPDCAVTSDAAAKFGFGAYIGKEWFANEWPQGTEHISVPVKELIPIVIAAELWGHCCCRAMGTLLGIYFSVLTT